MNTTNILIEILKKYQGELTEENILNVSKMIEIIKRIIDNQQQILIPSSEEITKIMENEINEQNIHALVSKFIPKMKIKKQKIQEMWRETIPTSTILHNIIEIVSNPEIKKYVSKPMMNKLTETAQTAFTKLIECVNESIQMEIEENEKTPTESEEMEVKTIPIEQQTSEEEKKEDDINQQFEERMKTIQNDLDKIERKYESFKSESEKNGENINHFMEKEKPLKEVENLLRRGIEVNELNMRIMMELDGYVGLNEKNRQQRKELIIKIQHQLDENEEIMGKVKKTQKMIEKIMKEKENEMKQKQQEEEKMKPREIKEERVKKLKQKSVNEQLRDMINWNEMKIKPRFNVNEQGNTIIVTSQINGMKEEDIEVTLTKNDNLKITGVKKPSEIEMNMMIKTIKQRYPKLSDEELIALIKQYSNGRYGSFTQVYELPENIELEKITKRYEDGILQITLPMKPKQLRNQGRYPFGNYTSFNPFGGFW